jgi:hypothetical protein
MRCRPCIFRNGLVAEFLLNADTGTIATDTVRRNDRSVSGAAAFWTGPLTSSRTGQALVFYG